MAKVTIVVCDKCGAQGADTASYEIRKGPKRATLDLCGDCAAPVEELLALGPQTRSGPRSVRRTPRQNVTTIEEIEAMKKKDAKKK